MSITKVSDRERELQAEIDRLAKDNAALAESWNRAKDAEEALQDDAERYRWLCNEACFTDDFDVIVDALNILDKEGIDAAIDKAMKGQL